MMTTRTPAQLQRAKLAHVYVLADKGLTQLRKAEVELVAIMNAAYDRGDDEGAEPLEGAANVLQERIDPLLEWFKCFALLT
jgi:hypothetical protein